MWNKGATFANNKLTREINNEEYTSKTFDRLYFAPLKSSHFDSINIRVYDDTGNQINLEYGKVVVFFGIQKITQCYIKGCGKVVGE